MFHQVVYRSFLFCEFAFLSPFISSFNIFPQNRSFEQGGENVKVKCDSLKVTFSRSAQFAIMNTDATKRLQLYFNA